MGKMEESESVENMDASSPRVPKTPKGGVTGAMIFGDGMSHHDTLQRKNPNLHLEMRDNLVWCRRDYDEVFEDEKPPEEEDPTCPMVLVLSLIHI